MDEEIWKDIAEFEGKYFISSHGRLKSIGGKYKKSKPDGYITEGCTDSAGYKVVVLFKPKQNMRRFRVHTLVAMAFISNEFNKKEVNHIDSNRANNHINNLEWVTHKENMQHALNSGRMKFNYGSSHGMSKLKESDVIEIRKIRKDSGLTYQKIAEMFNISRDQCGSIIRRRNWGWLI